MLKVPLLGRDFEMLSIWITSAKCAMLVRSPLNNLMAAEGIPSILTVMVK